MKTLAVIGATLFASMTLFPSNPRADEVHLNNSVEPKGSVDKSYFFSRVFQVGAETGFIYKKDITLLGGQKSQSFEVEWIYGPANAQAAFGGMGAPSTVIYTPLSTLITVKNADMATDQIMDALKKEIEDQKSKNKDGTYVWINTEKNNVGIAGGCCGGIILYHGLVLVTSADLPGVGSVLNIWNATIGGGRFYSDSALCFGPVSRSPLVLDLASPDMRSLRDALLVVSGMNPISCEEDKKNVGNETCRYTRATGGEPGPANAPVAAPPGQ
jgi:hypothetical protein